MEEQVSVVVPVNKNKIKIRHPDADMKIAEALSTERVISGYTIKEIAAALSIPTCTVKWHVDRLVKSGSIETTKVGKTILYKLKKTT